MNAYLRPLSAILVMAMLASLTVGGSIAAAAQAPTGAHTVALAAVPQSAEVTTRVAPLDRSSGADAIAIPNLAPMASAYYGTDTYTSCSPSCDLYALPGSLTLAGGATVPIWGYSTSAAGPATVAGPTLTVTEGTAGSITLHNGLSEPTSLTIAEAEGSPDTVGAAALTGTATYALPITLKAGTYLYEAGLTANGARQVGMGLYGALIVLPVTPTYSGEAVLVLSEVDPALNAAPTTFNMSEFAPKYWLINGKAYPETAPIAVTAGDAVLLRYVNAGLMHHSMSMLGLKQTIVSVDANASTNPSKITATTIPAGSTLDAVVQVPTVLPPGAQYAIFDAAPHLDNSGPAVTSGITIPVGGMLTFLQAAGGAATLVGPATTTVALTPDVTGGATPASVTLSASFDASAAAAEYFVNAIGASGTGCPLTPYGNPGSWTIAATGGTAACPDLSTLSAGNHGYYVHASDATTPTAIWGPFASAVLNLDKAGPTISGYTISPTVTNGTVDVAIHATASDVATGNQSVVQGEYFIDAAGAPGSGTPIVVAVADQGTIVILNAAIPLATFSGLTGTHAILVSAQDSFGNWGPTASTNLLVDHVSPTLVSASTTPNPTNGTFGVQAGRTGAYAQRLDATFTDLDSTIAYAEYFLDAPTTAYAMIPADGLFNSATEAAYQFLDLYAISQLSQGQHNILVRARDAAGNWSTITTVPLYIDKTGPGITLAAVSPNPDAGTAVVNITAHATDAAAGTAPASNIVAAEWFFGTDPGFGLGNPMTLSATGSPSVDLSATTDVSSRPAGTYTVTIRAQDAAHNWSPLPNTSVTFTLRPTVSAVSPNTGPSVGGTAVTITGTNFGAPATVRFGTVLATAVTVVNSTTITATAPARNNANPDVVDVTVTVGGQTSPTSTADTYTWVGPVPAAAVIPPAPAAGGAGGGTAPAPAAQAPSLAPSTLALRARPGGLQPAPFVIPGADAYHAEWVAQSAYPTATAGQLVEWVVAFKNTGSAGWYRGMLGANAALGSSQPLNNETAAQLGMDPGNWQYASRFSVQTTDYVAPGQTGWFVLQVKAPTTAGTYRISLRPVIDGVSWMEDYGVYFDLTVK